MLPDIGPPRLEDGDHFFLLFPECVRVFFLYLGFFPRQSLQLFKPLPGTSIFRVFRNEHFIGIHGLLYLSLLEIELCQGRRLDLGGLFLRWYMGLCPNVLFKWKGDVFSGGLGFINRGFFSRLQPV